MMIDLQDFQKKFLKDLTTGSQDSLPFIDDSKGQALARLQVYQTSSRAIITDVLGDFFPVVKQLVGASFFAAMVKEYLAKYPPQQGNIDQYGESFSAFIREFEPANQLPYLPDVAGLEWLRHQVFIAEDVKLLAPEFLQGVAPEKIMGLQLRLQPAVGVYASQYPIVSIWKMNQPEADDNPLNLAESKGENALVVREGDDVVLYEIQRWQLLFIEQLKAGKTLGEVLELPEIVGQGEGFQSFFAMCLQIGVFKDIEN